MQVALAAVESLRIKETHASLADLVATASDRLYRCQFQKVIALVDSLDLSQLDEQTYIDLQMLKSTALYELQMVPQALEILKSFGIFRKIACKASYNYSAGKLSYFEADYASAENYFAEIKHLTSDVRLHFRALLGLANVYMSQEKMTLLPAVLAELNQLQAKVNPEEKISFLLLLGNHYANSNTDRILARKYFKLALSESTKHSWIYFINRCLYSLAKLERQAGNTKELHCLLDLLRSSLQESECLWLKFLVNDAFKETNISSEAKIEMDTCNLRLKINDRWLEFHDKPLLFHFIKLLRDNRRFVTKAEIASKLWPNQAYLPRTHDPRIFDIAKRIRSLVELYDKNPMVLLSGRQGYKLAAGENHA